MVREARISWGELTSGYQKKRTGFGERVKEDILGLGGLIPTARTRASGENGDGRGEKDRLDIPW